MSEPLLNPLIKSTDLIVQICEQARRYVTSPEIKSQREHFAPDDFMYHYGTVKMELPRRQGHTTAALQLVARYPGSILIVPQYEIMKNVQTQFKKYILDQAEIDRACKSVITIAGIRNKATFSMRNNERPFLIFDGAARMKERYIREAKKLMQADVFVELQ